MTASLFDRAPAEPRTISERFDDFHAANPHVFAHFVRLAKEAKAAGCERYSADGILHVLRYDLRVRTGKSEGFALNNSFSSRYARLAVQTYPELRGFFEFRSLKAQ